MRDPEQTTTAPEPSADAEETPSDDTPADAASEGPAAADRPLDVRAVLAEIGAEETVARLEARVEGLEQDLERAGTRAREGERARQGELQLMRARVEDALALVHDTMDEQRSAWTRFEDRFGGLVAAAEEHSRSFVSELREELSPRVERALLRTDEASAELRGEIAGVADELEQRGGMLSSTLAALREELDRATGDLAERLDREVEARAAALAALETTVTARADALEESATDLHREAEARLESLRRELDAAVGELRAGLNLRANELRDDLTRVRQDLEATIEDQRAAAEDLERRWVAGTREVVRRVEHSDSVAREALHDERADRETADDALGEQLARLSATVDELATRVTADLGRQSTTVATLERVGEELATRLDVLQGKVAEAVSLIASQLTNRVTTVAGEVDALRESSVRQQARLATLDHLARRVEELAERQAEPAPAPVDDDRLARIEVHVAELGRQVAAMGATVSGTAERAEALTAAVASLQDDDRRQDALRQEVRELAARSSELTHRLAETERLARTAGQAIAASMRQRARPGAPAGGAGPGGGPPAVTTGTSPSARSATPALAPEDLAAFDLFGED